MKKKIKFNNKNKIINPYYTNLYLSGGEIASGVINAAGQAIQSGIQAGQIADTSKMEENIKAASTANIGENAKSTNDLMNAWNSIDWQNGTSKQELYGDHGQRAAQAFMGMTQGATQGKGLFGRSMGVAGSALGTIIGSISAAVKSKKKAEEINQKANLANANQLSAFQNSASNLSENANLNALSTYAAEGGPLFTNGGQFDNDVTYINEGGTHEENIYDGVPQGMAPDGNPNLVEEGEVIYNDYVYSNRLKPDKKLLEAYNLPTKYKNKTFAEIADDLSKESKERQYDPISKRGLEDNMNKLQQAQDKFKEIKKQKQLNQLMSKLTNDDLSLLSEMAQSQQPQQTKFDLGGMETLAPNIQGFNVPQIQTPDVQQVSSTLTNTVNNTASKPFNLSYLKNDNITGQITDTLGQITGAIADAAKQNNAEKYRDLNKKGIVPAFAEGGYLFADGGDPLLKYISTIKDPTNRQKLYDEYVQYNYPTVNESDLTSVEPVNKSLFGNNTTEKNSKKQQQRIKTPKVKTELTEEQKQQKQQRQEKWNKFKEGLKNPDILRTIPIGVKGAMALSDALGWTNKTDYSNPNLIAKNTKTVGAPTIGNYMTYNPLDPNYMMNQQRQLAMANQNAIMNASMGNAGTAMAGLLANSYNNQIAQGDAYRKAMEEDFKRKQFVEDFNRGTNVQKAQLMLDADKANQKTFLESGLQQATAREAIDQALSSARSANLDNFLASLGDLGKETTDRNAVNTTIDKTGIPGAEDFKRKYGGKLKRNKKSKYFKTL